MSDHLLKTLKKGHGYTLDTSAVVTKCVCLTDRLGLAVEQFCDEFEGFMLSR